MSNTIRISQAVLNGIQSLKEDVAEGHGSEAALAARNRATAIHRGNERAARYWQDVVTACRKLERRSGRTRILAEA